VAISKETTGVCNDLSDVEGSTGVNTSSAVDPSNKRSGQAAVRDTAVVRSLWVGKCKARRASLAFDGLVNVGCCDSRGEIFTRDTGKGDVLVQVSLIFMTRGGERKLT
jgi:hypothetical protein